jgi:hypothetical protein
VILTGWKEISRHLRFGVRTVQRWQDEGLPVKRISNSRRSPVVADSEQLDAWILHRRLPPGAPPTLLEKRERVVEMQRTLEEHRKEFQVRVRVFKKQVAEFQAKHRMPTR